MIRRLTLSRWERVKAEGESVLSNKRDIGLALAGATGFILVCVTLIQRDSALGHDEAVYGLRGRYFATGEPTSGYWVAYRSPGVPFLLGIANRIFGARPGLDRLMVSFFGLLALFAAFSIVYRFTKDRVTSALTPLVMLGVSGFFGFSTTLLVDVPGLAVSLCCLAALVWSITDDFHFETRGILLVPILATIATTMRFGSPVVIAAGVAGLTAALARPVFLSPHRWRTTVRFAVTMFISLLGMLLVYSTTFVSRTSISPSKANAALVGPKFDATGRWATLQSFIDLHWPGQPVTYGVMSWPLTILVALALMGIAVEILRRGVDARHLHLIAMATVAWIAWAGVMNYSLPVMVANYAMLGSFFLAAVIAAGLDLLRRNLLDLPGLARVPSAAGVVVALLLLVPPMASSYTTATEMHDWLDGSYGVLRDGSRAAGEELGEDCVLLTGASPQVGYYSGCSTNAVGIVDGTRDQVLPATQVRLNQIAANGQDLERVGVVFLNRGKRQMTDAAADAILDLLIEDIVEIGQDEDGPRQHFWVDELVLCGYAKVVCGE